MQIFFKTFTKILGFLSALTVFFLIIGLISSFWNKNQNSNFYYYEGDKESKNIIALISISGPIISEPVNLYNFRGFKSLEAVYPSLIKDYLLELEEKNISGIIIEINSPGGSVAATHIIYELLENFKNKLNIPIFFHTTDIMASGSYWLALSGDKIFANYGAILGSIGVKGPDWLYYNKPNSISSGIFGNSIKSPNEIKLYSNIAGKSKDIFNPFRKPSNIEIMNLNNMVTDIYKDFVNLVSKKRKIESEIITKEIGAMIYNTKQAKSFFLIDDIKNIDETIKLMINRLNLSNFKLLTNKKRKEMNLFNSNILNSYFDQKKFFNGNKIINNKFCNNLINEFSVVSLSYNKNC